MLGEVKGFNKINMRVYGTRFSGGTFALAGARDVWRVFIATLEGGGCFIMA